MDSAAAHDKVAILGRTAALAVLLTFLLLLAAPGQGRAEMFVCRDSRGVKNFTNVRNSPDCEPFNLVQESGSWKGVVRAGRGFDPTRYDQEIWRIGARYNVDPSLIKAIIEAESHFDHRAISSKGAQGLMQLMPGTARDLRVADPFDPYENIDGGTRYFRSLLDTFNEDLVLSLAAYNAGPGLVGRTGGVPQIPETVQYIKKVLKRYKWYKATWLASNNG